MEEKSWVFVFPYLQIAEKVTCGGWVLEQIRRKDLARKQSPDARDLLTIFDRHHNHRGKPLQTAVVARRIGPRWNSDQERSLHIDALQTAVTFSVLDANAKSTNEIDWSSPSLEAATAEAAILSITPQAALRGGATIERGGAISSRLVHGLGTLVFQSAPEGLICSPVMALDQELMQAVFENAVKADSSETGSEHREIHAAIYWFIRAWDNSPMHKMPDILVKLRTSLEALSGQSNTEKGAKVLRSIYSQGASLPGGEDLLWKASENTFERTRSNGKVLPLGPFDHWFWNLADIRNSIVHDTHDPQMNYEAENSPFEGNVFEIAERVCRELIKVRLSQQDRANLLTSRLHRQILEKFETLGELSKT